MHTNVLIFILLFGLLQALVVVAALLTGKRVAASQFFLSGYITVIIFQLAFKVMSKMWLLDTFKQAYFLSYDLPLLYGPLLLLFAKSSLVKNYKCGWDMLHFSPFIFYLVFFLFANSAPGPPGFTAFIQQATVRLIVQILSIAIYHAIVFRMQANYLTKEEKANLYKVRVGFVKKFSAVSLAVTTCITITLFFLYINFPFYQDVRWIFTLLTFFIYWLSYEGLRFSELFTVIHGNGCVKNNDHYAPFIAHYSHAKYSNSALRETEIQRILSALRTAMEIDKMYLDPLLNIDKLSETIHCQKHHLSQVLNNNIKKSFNEFVNEKRLAEVKAILADPQFANLKIASIAYEAGFNSLSSFNEIFKKTEGTTPSQFKSAAQQQNQSLEKRV